MNDLEIESSTPKSQGANTATLLVSLYLAVLAFFILLNSISETNEEAAKKVLKSVVSEFSNTDTEVEWEGVEIKRPTGAEALLEHNIAQLEELVQLHAVEFHTRGNEIIATLPINKVFKSGSKKIRRSATPLLNNLVKVLLQDMEQYRFQVEFTIHNTKTNKNRGPSLAIQQAGTFAKYLKRNGLAHKQILIGTTNQHPNHFKLGFYIRTTKEVTS